MKRQKNYYERSICLLSQLHKEHPECSLAQHIATAFSSYKDIYSLPDIQFYELLLEYKNLTDMDNNTSFDVNKVMKDGMNLYNILEEDEDNE